MKFIINSKLLKDALERLSAAYNPRAVVPVVQYAKTEVMDGCIELTMTDLQTTIRHKVECETSEKGAFLLSYKETKNITSTIDAIATVEHTDKSGVSISFESDVFGLGKTDSYEDFPLFPEIKRGNSIVVGKEFFSAIRTASKSVSKDVISQYIYTHVCVELSKGHISIIGTDNNTMFSQTIPMNGISVGENVELLIPFNSIAALNNFTDAEVYYDKKNILFVTKNTEVCILLGDGKYLPWRNIIPEHHTNLSLDINDFTYAINKSFAIISPNVFSITLQPSSNSLGIKTTDDNTGMCCDSVVPCKSSASFKEINFNRNQLLTSLKQLHETGGQDVELSMPSPSKPASIKMTGINGVSILISPVK